MEQNQARAARVYAKRSEHPETHYSTTELARFLQVPEKTILQRVERLSRRTYTTKRGNTRRPTLWASAKSRLLNETAGKRLLRLGRDNFRAIPTHVRPINTLSYKQVHDLGLSDKHLFELVCNDRIETHRYKGRYMFNADDVAAVVQRLPTKAPDDMIPLHRLKYARKCSKQAIYAWADRNPDNQGIYRSDTSVACLRHVSVHAAYAYLTKALGSATAALNGIKHLGMKYFRQIKPARLTINLNLQPEPKLNPQPQSETLSQAPEQSSNQAPQVFLPRYGHDLISLAT